SQADGPRVSAGAAAPDSDGKSDMPREVKLPPPEKFVPPASIVVLSVGRRARWFVDNGNHSFTAFADLIFVAKRGFLPSIALERGYFCIKSRLSRLQIFEMRFGLLP